MSWHQWSAKCVNSEAKTIVAAAAQANNQRALQHVRVEAAPAAVLPPPAVGDGPAHGLAIAAARAQHTYTIKQTPLHMFREEFLAEQLANGLKLNPVCKETWRLVREAFAALPEADRHGFERMSESSAHIARANRDNRKAIWKLAVAAGPMELPPPIVGLGAELALVPLVSAQI